MSLVLHVGLPKTGTTYLQEEILPHVPNVHYLGRLETEILQPDRGPACGTVGQFFTCTTRVWDDVGDRLFGQFIGPASDAEGEFRTVLISDEGIGKAGKHPEHMEMHLRCLKEKAREWGYDSVKIICVIRRQDQWIGSHYAQVSDRNENVSQSDFESYVYDRLNKDKNLYRFGILLDYRCLRDALCRVVGDENVAIIPYELLQEDPQTFLRAFLKFIGTVDPTVISDLCSRGTEDGRNDGVNKRSSGSDRWAIRKPAKMNTTLIRLRPARVFAWLGLPTTIMWPQPDWNRPGEVTMTPELKKAVMNVYSESNEGLSRDLNIDLSAYGYY